MQTQYCQGITAPAFSCTGQTGAQFITDPTSQLKGTWTDPTPVPADILTTGLVSNLTTDPIEAEWNDAQTNENGDKCAWMGLQNITLGNQFYAVQPLWSNPANGSHGGCAVSR